MMEGEFDFRFKVSARTQVLAQPLEGDDSYEDGGEAKDKTEKPQGVDTDNGVRRSKCRDGEALGSDVRSIRTAFDLGKDAQQEYV